MRIGMNRFLALMKPADKEDWLGDGNNPQDKPDDKKTKGKEDKEDDDSDDDDDDVEDDDEKKKKAKEKEDDFELSFKKKKKKKDKDESIQDLRKSRDTYKSKVKELTDQLDSATKTSNPALKKVADYIKDRYGDLTEEAVDKFINKNKTRKEAVQKLEDLLKEKDERVKQYSIIESDEYKSQYGKPLHDSAIAVLASITMFDGDGKPMMPEIFQRYHSEILKSADEMDAAKLKSIIARIKSEFQEETGEQYEAPSIGALMADVRNYANLSDKARSAIKNWEETRKQEREKQIREQSEQFEKSQKELRRRRRRLAEQAMEEFDLDSVEGVIEEDDVAQLFNSELRYIEEGMDDNAKLRPFNVTLTDQVKARMFDKMLPRFKELMEELNIKEKRKRESLEPGSKKGKEKGGEEDKKDWLE